MNVSLMELNEAIETVRRESPEATPPEVAEAVIERFGEGMTPGPAAVHRLVGAITAAGSLDRVSDETFRWLAERAEADAQEHAEQAMALDAELVSRGGHLDS